MPCSDCVFTDTYFPVGPQIACFQIYWLNLVWVKLCIHGDFLPKVGVISDGKTINIMLYI